MTPTPATASPTVTLRHENDPGKAGLRPYWIAVPVLIWFATSFAAANDGYFQASPGKPPLNFLVGIAIPVGLFFLTYSISSVFRAFIRGLDPVTLTLFQSWRVIGSMFMVFYLFDMLPGFFAYPAGLGDVAVGLTAPFVALKLLRDPNYGGGRGFVIWNALGLFDFVLAVGTGSLASGAFGTAFIGGGPTTSMMSSLPLAMIPGFLVPLYILLHISALISARSKARGG